MLPCRARLVPIPVAIRRSVPQKKESPSPASGPIRDALTLSIAVPSISCCWLFFSSIAVVMPSSRVTICGVVLKNTRWRFNAAASSAFCG